VTLVRKEEDENGRKGGGNKVRDEKMQLPVISKRKTSRISGKESRSGLDREYARIPHSFGGTLTKAGGGLLGTSSAADS